MPVNQPAQYQSLNLERLDSQKTAIINVVSYTCAFPAMSCQKVCCETGMLNEIQSKIPSLAVAQCKN